MQFGEAAGGLLLLHIVIGRQISCCIFYQSRCWKNPVHRYERGKALYIKESVSETKTGQSVRMHKQGIKGFDALMRTLNSIKKAFHRDASAWLFRGNIFLAVLHRICGK